MKKRLVLVFAASALLALAGCGGTTAASTTSSNGTSEASSSVPASSTSSATPIVLTSLSITNKTALQATWYVGQAPRYVTLSTDPAVNTAALLASGELKVTSSDPTIVSVQGLYVSAVKEGTATITVTLGGKTDNVQIVTSDIAKVTTNKISDIVNVTDNYKIIGQITSVLSATAYFVDDGTGSVEVYGNSSVTPTAGMNVVVYGKVVAYHNIYEYDSKALVLEYKDTVTPQNQSAAVELVQATLKIWTGLKAPDNEKTKGIYKFTAVQNHAGSYAAFTIGGIPVEPSGTDNYIDGHTYSVVCCFAGSGSAYVNVAVISIKDETKVLASVDNKNLLPKDTAQISVSDATDEKATFTFASDKTDVATVDDKGKITAVAAGTAKITITSSTSYTADVSVNVCAAVKANTIVANGNYQVTGKVTCVTTKGYIVDDGTAGISVYLNASPTDASPTVKQGALVSVTGEVTNYNNIFQFGSGATVKTATDAVTPTAAVTLTDAVVAGWKALAAPIVSGPLYTAIVTDTKDGNYDVFDFNGIKVEPSYSSLKFDAGKRYTITGYFGGYNTKYGYAAFYLTSADVYVPDVDITAEKTVVDVNGTIALTAVDNTTTSAVTWTWTVDVATVASVTADATDSSKATVKGLAAGTVVVTATSSSGKTGTVSIVVSALPAAIETKSLADVAKYTASDNTVIKIAGVVANIEKADYGNLYLMDPTTGDKVYVYGSTADAEKLVKTDTGLGYYTGAFTSGTNFAAAAAEGDYVEMEVVISYYTAKSLVEAMGVVTSVVKPTDAAYTYKYAASVVAPENGTVTLSKEADLAFGDVVTVNATPASGYAIGQISVDHGYGKEALTPVSGVYTFKANVKNVVTAVFASTAPVSYASAAKFDFSAIPCAASTSPYGALDNAGTLALFTADTYKTSGTNPVTAVIATKAYQADNTQGPKVLGLKLGASSSVGSLALTLNVDVAKVVIHAYGWSSTKLATFTVGDAPTVALTSTTGEDASFAVTAGKSLTISVNKYCVITAIEFFTVAA